jgi:integrase
MPKRTPSGTKGLMKRHVRGCTTRETPSRCACEWRGRYKRQEVGLSQWSGTTVDPRTVTGAREVFARMVTAIDDKSFDPKGEVAPLGTDDRFRTLINEYITAHVERAGLDGAPLTGTGLLPCLNVIKTVAADGVCLGLQTNEALVATPTLSQDWLNAMQRQKGWKPKTWNYYYGLLFSICEWATMRKTNGVPRMVRNPIKEFAKYNLGHYEQIGRIYEDLEDRLFAACKTLNAPTHLPNARAKLTQEQADAIRAAVAGGARQKDVAVTFQVSPAVVCDIVAGKIWNPAKYQPTTKGDDMERRLIASIDGGMRAGELLGAQLKHVNFREPFLTEDGGKGYRIVLPPDVCKGGKTTGKSETVYAGSPRFAAMLEARRAHLIRVYERRRLATKDKTLNVGDAYLFGDADGRKLQGFRRQYRNLYDAAGLVHGVDYGRDLGLVWHTTRHEYCSRIGEQSNGDVRLIKKAGRFKNLKTAEIYTHLRDREMEEVATLVNRRRTGTVGSKRG